MGASTKTKKGGWGSAGVIDTKMSFRDQLADPSFIPEPVKNLLDPLGLRSMLKKPKVPKPKAPPPPSDEAEPYFRAMARMNTERQLRAGTGRTAAFASAKPSILGG
jgi:hypothetical protein